MTKDELLRELQQETYATLKSSPVHGIGVFALRDIPAGCRTIFSAHGNEWVKVSFAEVEQLPAPSRELIETYCLFDDEHYFVPDHGFKIMDMVLYLNHSSAPNLISVNEGEFFEAVRDIPAGEELFIDYNRITGDIEPY